MLGDLMRHRGRAAALAAMLIAISGCGGSAASPESSPAPTEGASPAPAGASTPTAAPGASVAAGGDGALCAVAREPCPIAAGTYRTDPFVPVFSFTVEDGWTNDRNFADGGGISKGPGGIYWASGISTGRANGAEVTFDSTVTGFADHLRSIDGFTVTDGPPAAIGGVDAAMVLDVVTGQGEAPGLYFVAEDAYNLGPGEKARFYLFEIDGTLVTFVAEAWAEGDFDAVMAQSQPVLDSIAWG